MYLSLNWLRRHIDLDGLTPEQIALDLTLSTAEVEGLERFLPHLSDVTVGYVKQRDPHPGADKLGVCTVDVGGPEELQIVCGAPNVAGGQKVAVATLGTRLPGDLKIKKAKIRGVESRGMICSVRELGLGDEHDGIWVLPDDAQVGAPVAEQLGLDDWVIEIDNKSITHRPDLWGHRGIAAELGAIYERPLKPLETALPASGDGKAWPLRVESGGCSRYVAVCVDGVRNGPSPEWLRNLLLAVGQRPIDLLVDVSNFVMLDLGQPNHLFDRTALSPEGIVVRDARAGETLTTLDGEQRTLATSDLLICSGDEPVALAGVMGGEASAVAGDTDQLLLEVASFDAGTVRRTSARLGLRTDASARFEKSLSPTLPMEAAGHLVGLLRELQPDVRVAAPISDAGDWTDPARTLSLRPARVRALLGCEIGDDEIRGILERLHFAVTIEGDAFRVAVPSARATKDVTIEQDLVEEVGRIFRYGNVPEQSLTAEVTPPPHDPRRAMVRAIEDRLAGGARFHQTISYSFHSDDLLRRVGLADVPHVEVANPVAEGASRVRRSVVPSLLELLEAARRQRSEVRLFEVGKGYLPSANGEEPAELHELGLVLCTEHGGDALNTPLARAQAQVVDLLDSLELEAGDWRAAEPRELAPWAHPGRAVALGPVAGSAEATGPLAIVAALEPGLAREFGLTGELQSETAVALLSIDALLAAPAAARRYRSIPRFPGIKVDVAVLVPEACPAADVRAAIEKAGKGLVADTELFDLYSGENLPAGTKSLAWHVVLQAADRTLGEKEQKKFLERFARGAQGLGGELRTE